MGTVILACRTIKKEVEAAYERCGCAHELIWVDSGLHSFPEKLNVQLQGILDSLDTYYRHDSDDATNRTSFQSCATDASFQSCATDASNRSSAADASNQSNVANNKCVDRVLMTFGVCGNSILGLKTGNFELILPKVDDCITLILGSYDIRKAAMEESPTYFLTESWLAHESGIWNEYLHCLKKYGQEDTDAMFKTMLANYERFGVIDTGCYDFEHFYRIVSEIANVFNLEVARFKGTTSYIEKLLTGPWTEDRFRIFPPNNAITFDLLAET